MEEDVREAVPATDALNQESAILDIFEKQGFKNPKKVKKLAQRLLADAKSSVQKYLLMDILSAAEPAKYVKDCINKIRDCALIIEQFIEEGHHGMIMMGVNVFPVTLDTRENWLKEGKEWHPEDEKLIQNNAAEMWMKQNNKGYFFGKVVLFPNFGFSGVPRVIEMQCTADTEGMKRYPGTNYFYKDSKAA